MSAYDKCPECRLTQGRHAPGCPADDWYHNRIEAEAEYFAGAQSPLDRAVKAVQAAGAEAARLGSGIWQIHYEPGVGAAIHGTAGGAGSLGDTATLTHDDGATRRHDDTATRRHDDTTTPFLKRVAAGATYYTPTPEELLKAVAAANRAEHDVTNPSHYRLHPSGVECITITEHMGFNLGNAVKYIWRADLKHEAPLDDLKKARWYLDREIAKRERETGARNVDHS